MNGFFQVFFYFSYTTVVCCGIFIVLGTATAHDGGDVGVAVLTRARARGGRAGAVPLPWTCQERSATRARACLCTASTGA